MKSRILIKIYFLSLLGIGLIRAEGFIFGTLIQVKTGLVPIESLAVGDQLTFYSKDIFTEPLVMHINQQDKEWYVKIEFGDDSISADLDQKFYVPDRHQWVNASNLKSSDLLLCSNGLIISIDAINFIYEPQVMYVISVDRDHLFCVSSHGIIVHNIEPVSTGGAIVLMGGLSIVCPPAAATAVIGKLIAFGAVALGAYYAHKRFQKKQQSNYALMHNGGPNMGGHDNKDPRGDDDDEDHPYGLYEDAGYHHRNSMGNKSISPKNGQKCLDNSFDVGGNSGRRISIEDGSFVILLVSSPGKYHGYIVKTWEGLAQCGSSTQLIRNAFKRHGLVNRSGKIIKSLLR